MTECTELLREARLEIEVLKASVAYANAKRRKTEHDLEDAFCTIHNLHVTLDTVRGSK